MGIPLLYLNQATQANLASCPQWDGNEMSTGQMVLMLCGLGVKTSMAHSWSG